MQAFRHYRGEEAPIFVHESEREVAALPDEAGIPWMYEPRMFVLEEQDGTIVQGFTPDFYLPDADVYLECTTARQSLTTRKNGKIRKLRDRGEVVAVHYRRDLERLLRRYRRRPLQRDLASAARERRNGRSSAVSLPSSAEKPGVTEYQASRLKRPKLTP